MKYPPHLCRGPFDAGPDLAVGEGAVVAALKYPPHLSRGPFDAGPGLAVGEGAVVAAQGLGPGLQPLWKASHLCSGPRTVEPGEKPL